MASIVILEPLGLIRLGAFALVFLAAVRRRNSFFLPLGIALLGPGLIWQGPFSASQRVEAELLAPDVAVAWALSGWWLGKSNENTKRALPFQLILLAQVLSSLLAIAYNLQASTSEPHIRGILQNLLFFHKGSWFGDYCQAIKNVYSVGAFCILAVSIPDDAKKGDIDFNKLWKWLAVIALGIFTFAFMQRLLHFGKDLYGFKGGLHGLLPDAHAFASFAFVIFMGALAGFGAGPRSAASRYLLLGLALIAIFLSDSKYTMVLTLFIAPLFGVWFFGRRSLAGSKLAYSACLVGLVVLALIQGDDLWTRFLSLLENRSPAAFNHFLTFRPEIYGQAWHAFAKFPWAGIGSANFFWTGSLPGFSISPFLIRRGGENVHSFFLQMLVEQGVFGVLCWFILLVELFRRLSPKNEGSSSAILALSFVVGGNIIGHSLLTRECAFLFFVLAGFALSYGPNLWYVPSRSGVLVFSGAMAIFALGGFVAGKDLEPFGNGEKCFSKKFWPEDGQLAGAGVMYLKPPVNEDLVLKVRAHQPDIKKRSLVSRVQVFDPRETKIYSQQFEIKDHLLHEIAVPGTKGLELVRVEVLSNRCFTPANWGIGFDERAMALQVVNTPQLGIRTSI